MVTVINEFRTLTPNHENSMQVVLIIICVCVCVCVWGGGGGFSVSNDFLGGLGGGVRWLLKAMFV